MHLVNIGLNHKTAPIELREKLAVGEDQLAEALVDLAARKQISECLILSTCNRTEVYAYTSMRADDATIIEWLAEFCALPPEQFKDHLYSKSGHKSVEHLFGVVAGIDSMVVGEDQILGQVKDAYAAARQANSTGSVLNSLFQQAINVGKRARTETDIGRGAFSVGSVAVQLAKSIFDELKGRTVLIVGAGEVGELAITHLVSSGASEVLVANRTHDRALDLANRFVGRAVRFEDFPSVVTTADIVITSTGAKKPIIDAEMVSSAMRSRRGRPVFFIDIAVPRDIAPDVARIDNVFVYNIDDLQAVVEADAASRQVEVAKVESIIGQEVGQFMLRFRTLDAVPVITALREKLEGIRTGELEKLKGKLGHLSPEDLAAIDAATRSIVNKICHQPVIQTKEYSTDKGSSAKLETICELFGICPVEKDAD